MSKKLLRSGLIVSAMTLLSRILGLVRDVVIAHLLGAGMAADVFFFANRIPNFLRRLFAEGAFNQAFIPVMTDYKQQGDDSVRQLLAVVAGTLGGIVSVVTLLGVLGSGVVTAVFGWGWFWEWWQGGAGGEKFELASLMLKITFPYLWFITFTAMAGAVLNTFGRFGAAAFTPVLLNVAMIACAWWLAPHLDQPELSLAIGVFVGGLLQFLFQIPFLLRLKLLVRPRWDWHHPGVVRIRTLMLPALFGVSVSQINLLINTLLASFLSTGAISHLYYSDRLLEFPLGLFAVAISTVILPSLSQKHHTQTPQAFSQTLDWGVRIILLLGFPAMLGMLCLGEPILRVLFMRGEFDLQAVNLSSASLFASSLGLLPLMLIKVLAPGFYARQDTKTPVRIGIIAMICNMVCNVLFIYPLDYVGLALSTAVAAFVNAGLLFKGLYVLEVYRPELATLGFILKVMLATAVMALGLWWYSPPLEVWAAWSLGQASLALAAALAGAIGLYALTLLVCGVRLADLKSQASV